MRKPGQVLLDTNFLVDFNKVPSLVNKYNLKLTKTPI